MGGINNLYEDYRIDWIRNMDCVVTFVDLDDTLFESHTSYDRILDIISQKATRLDGISKELFITYYEEIEARNFEHMPSAYHRTLTCLIETYNRCCATAQLEVNELQIREITASFNNIFCEKKYRQQGLIEGAKETLGLILETKIDGRPMLPVLFTSGGPVLQKPKIKALELDNWFLRAEIAYFKTKEVFEQIIEKYGGDPKAIYGSKPTVMIGNSSRHDINPAVEAGISGIIHILNEPWNVDKDPKGVYNDNRILTFSSIAEVAENWDAVKQHFEKVLRA